MFSVSLSFVCLPVWCRFTSLAEMDMFLCLWGGSGGEIQAASLSCVKQKRATGQLCFRPERRNHGAVDPYAHSSINQKD